MEGGPGITLLMINAYPSLHAGAGRGAKARS